MLEVLVLAAVSAFFFMLGLTGYTHCALLRAAQPLVRSSTLSQE